LPLPDRLTAALRSAVAPGLGLLPDQAAVAAALLVAAFASTWTWFRWGVGLPAIVVWWAGIVVTVRLLPSHTHEALAAAAGSGGYGLAAHEFTWVMAVYVVVYWFSLFLYRLPFVERLAARRRLRRPPDETALRYLPPVERARAVAIWGIARAAGGQAPSSQLLAGAAASLPEARRARAISLLAHGDWRQPLRRDNAPSRAALILAGADADGAVAGEAGRQAAGARLAMPASEPGWVSLLDGTLLAAALQASGDAGAGRRWGLVLDRWFRLKRGHRPEARHDFVGVTRGRAPAWEHATAMATAAAHGWCEPAPEWVALRQQVFAAIGRGGRSPGDNRLVAAGRCWAALTRDDEAGRLLRRVTSSPRDPLAQALDALAVALAANPGVLLAVEGKRTEAGSGLAV
jgi:hypothetical protein